MTILTPIFAQDSDRVAILAGKQVITYGRLCEDIDSMAHWLFDSGLEPGDRITIHVNNVANPDYWDWIMHLGAIRAGLVHSTGAMPPQIARTGALGPYKAAVGHLADLAKQANPELKLEMALSGSTPLSKQVDFKKSRRKLDKLEEKAVRLLGTSGTTGRPKVISWDAPMIEARLKQVREIGGMNADTKLFCGLGLITTTGLRYPLAGWQIGALVILSGIGEDRTEIADAVGQSTFLAASPFRMQGFLRSTKGDWPDKDKRIVELFGGRVPPGLHEQVLKRCCDTLLMSYGATEVGRVACGETSLIERHSGAVGMIQPGITVEIVNREFKPVEPGEIGIVRMKSDFMIEGYIGQPAKPGPRAPLRDGWFYPGDFGILYEDGMFAITGRLTDTLNVAGAKISPIAIEDKIGQLPEIEDCCAMALQLDSGDVLTIAVVVGDDVVMKDVRQKVARALPKGFPFSMIRMGKIPRNAMGRIPRGQVTKMVTARAKKLQEERRAATPKDD